MALLRTILRISAVLPLVFSSVAMAAPRDRIDLKDIKEKIALTAGSKGTIQFKQDGNKLTEAKLVKDADEKQPGISVEFKKEPEFVMLALSNNLSKALRYRAAIRLKGHKEYIETSLVLPVEAGLASFESWQDPVEELVLFDFKLADDKP